MNLPGAIRPLHSRPLLACVLMLAALLLAMRPVAAEIRWRNGSVSPARQLRPAELRRALDRLGARPTANRVVVQFDGPLDSVQRTALRERGMQLLNYLGDDAYFARLADGLDVVGVATTPGLIDVAAIEPGRKLHPDLALGIVHPWAVVTPPAKSGEPAERSDAPRTPVVATYVMFHRDFDLERGARPLVARHGGKVRSFIRGINGAVVHLPASAVTALAGEDDVMYIEPPLPALTAINDSNRTRVGVDILEQPPYSLDGSGVDVFVYDSGQVLAHGDLTGRLTVGASDTSSISDHSTHVACTVGGDGSGSGGTHRGMAPGVEIISFGFEQEGGLQQGFLYTDPGDLEADYTEAITVLGADISNNSIGTNTASNGFPCEWEGDYGVTGALIDAIVEGSTGDPFRVVWANGNERSSGRCGTTYLTTAPPACAKNHITVGALDSDTDGVTSFTSWGPTDDGRLKPDVSGPGCEAGGDGGVTSCSSGGGYNVKCGTSMASPTVCGIGALMLQHYRAVFPGLPDFRNATLKAILANTAEDIVDPGPDYQSGYGSVRAVPAIDLIGEGRLVEAEVSQGEIYSFLILVGPQDTELKVTVAWDDPPGTPNVDPVLVNDLDLRVVAPDDTVHLPWTLDPANPANPAMRTLRDGVNNIEQVAIDAPAPGAYRVEVEGFNITDGPTQPFGAAAAPTLINCAPAGILSTNPQRISCDADLSLQVIDCDLNTDDGLTETVEIGVVSGSEPSGETVTLTESAPESAAFLGTLPVSTTDAGGVLQITEGETITATYIDADDGDGGTNVVVTQDVIVDCTAPSITSVTVAEINPRDATVAIDSDEPARVTVHYGTVCGASTDAAASLQLDTSRSVRLTNLSDDTVYFFHVDARDEAGNAAVDDNGGQCYSFATPEIPDFFTESFASGIDLAGLSATFTPNASTDFYDLCVESLAGGFPTDPTGGTDSGLGDDQPTSFTLGGGAMVSLYGQSYDTIFVGPNGYLTFGSGDSTYNESIDGHFSLPRVAALFDDLNPAAGGSISWKELPDRVAVTWDAVPEYSTTNSNSVQIEMFFDGTIRLSWINLESSDAIVGLSEGVGRDPDYFASDLSGGASCGPRPPFVQTLTVQTDVGTPVSIALQATDDGLPAPAALTYRITSLPAYGTLTDEAVAAIIDSTPYDLVGGANQVTYTPEVYQGADAFEYRADDGGLPPDGGESAAGTVHITAGGPQVLHEFLVDDTDPGWSTTAAWAFGAPTGGGSHSGDPSSGATGVNVYGYNLSGDYVDNMGTETLTSTAIDLSAATGTRVEFQRWLGVESATYDHATFQVSVDGTSWTTVWDHVGTALDESAWSQQSYDISALADGQASVSLRWIMGTTDGSVTYPGWNIDDVRILGTTPLVCSNAPGETVDLMFDDDRETLRWVRPAEMGGVLPIYDTLRSSNAQDFVTTVQCVESDGTDTEAVDRETPPSGSVYHYLVRAENGCGAGPLGAGRSAAACP